MVLAWKVTWERSCPCRDSGAGAPVAERAGTSALSVRMQPLMAAGWGHERKAGCHERKAAMLLLLFRYPQDLSSVSPSPALVSEGPQTLRIGSWGPPFRNPHCFHHQDTELQNSHPLSTSLASHVLSCLPAVLHFSK